MCQQSCTFLIYWPWDCPPRLLAWHLSNILANAKKFPHVLSRPATLDATQPLKLWQLNVRCVDGLFKFPSCGYIPLECLPLVLQVADLPDTVSGRLVVSCHVQRACRQHTVLPQVRHDERVSPRMLGIDAAAAVVENHKGDRLVKPAVGPSTTQQFVRCVVHLWPDGREHTEDSVLSRT